MLKEEIGLGNSVEEATKQAISLLPADVDYKIEIIDDYKPKVLGLFGGHPAKVKAIYEVADPKPSKKKPQKNGKKAEKTEKKAPVKEEVKEEPKVELNYIPVSELKADSPAKRGADYLESVLSKMGVENLVIKAAEIENGTQLLIEGDNLGICIGRRGETLDALQYLASFAANANQSGYYRIVLNICNYREKREDTLKSLARRMASQVLRTGRNRSLEPMNPYERRIIHTEVQNIEGVISSSVGDGINRHVVICPEGGSPKKYDGRRNDRRGGRNDRRGGRDRRPSNKVEAPVREPRSDFEEDLPLGKIK